MELTGEIARRRLGQQRIGHRLHVDGTTITWRVQRPGRFGRMKPFDREAVIDNISVTGAGILLLTDPRDQIGEVVDVRIGEAWGRLIVRRYAPTGDPAVSFWGVEFIRPEGDFHATIAEIIRREDASAVESDDDMRG